MPFTVTLLRATVPAGRGCAASSEASAADSAKAAAPANFQLRDFIQILSTKRRTSLHFKPLFRKENALSCEVALRGRGNPRERSHGRAVVESGSFDGVRAQSEMREDGARAVDIALARRMRIWAVVLPKRQHGQTD